MTQATATPAANAHACQPWCVSHDHENGICYGTDLPIPYNTPSRVGISHTPDTGTVISIGDDYLPVQVARGLWSALSQQLRLAGAVA